MVSAQLSRRWGIKSILWSYGGVVLPSLHAQNLSNYKGSLGQVCTSHAHFCLPVGWENVPKCVGELACFL